MIEGGGGVGVSGGRVGVSGGRVGVSGGWGQGVVAVREV